MKIGSQGDLQRVPSVYLPSLVGFLAASPSWADCDKLKILEGAMAADNLDNLEKRVLELGKGLLQKRITRLEARIARGGLLGLFTYFRIKLLLKRIRFMQGKNL